ncbi:MAG: hypothetical protein JNJ83_23810 [Verrucomicrobiaceae bacterium]|nr:hypothetical protein [Verrucomicrobiaceae bacterium]
MKTLTLSFWLGSFLMLTGLSSAASQKVILGPPGSDNFGNNLTVLPNGNFVVRDPGYDQPSPALTDCGAVYLYRHDGTLISTITGSAAGDAVGGAVVVLANGNFFVRSSVWNGSRGAVTWGHAETGFIGGSGVVSAANSLVGSTSGDMAVFAFAVLKNGNYVIQTAGWDHGGIANAGAATWCNGNTGRTGAIGNSISLVGTQTNDQVGGFSAVELTNGNVLIRSPSWDNGGVSDAGAVTWMNGSTGLTGPVTSSNSLVGTSPSDQVGSFQAVGLTNGNYVVVTPGWNGATNNEGAVTWGDGSTGVSGNVSVSNSLTGKTDDNVGSVGVVALSNGNYVVHSQAWFNPDTGAANAGAVTWCNGSTGTTGLVSSANSLVGTQASDEVGVFGTVALNNGNYVVHSPSWINGSASAAGAVTWGNGTTGTSGPVSAANSLVGSTVSDRVGLVPVVGLANGNYVVTVQDWDSDTVVNAGAVTFGNGTTGTSGPVSAANSLIGTTAGDKVGSGNVVPLANGNYVVLSPTWNNGGIVSAGAVTWADGKKGIKGPVTTGNSLFGTTANDAVGQLGSVFALTNGNYVVRTTVWDNGAVSNAGAVTWGSGTKGIKGPITSSNSLVGSSTTDQIGNTGILILNNGNYVVLSRDWNNGPSIDVGAATWGDGTRGVKGVISASNSLIGTTLSDQVGQTGVALPNGNYVIQSDAWDNGLVTGAGAVTWGDRKRGVKGIVSSSNSLVGTSISDRLGGSVIVLPDGNYIARSQDFTIPLPLLASASAVALGDGNNGTSGILTTSESVFGVTSTSLLAPNYDAGHAQMIVGDGPNDRITILGNFLRTLARTGETAPGALDIAWAKPGLIAVNVNGDALFDSSLTGSGSTSGRNLGVFGIAGMESDPDLVLQSGDTITALGQNLPTGAKASNPGFPIFHQTGRGLFQITATGPGITKDNNRLLLRDNGAAVIALHRTGTAIPALGGGSISKFVEVLASHDQDLITLHYQLRSGGPVTGNNDTGLLLMSHGGSISSLVNNREGTLASTYNASLTGTLGQITRVSAGHGVRSYFIAAHKPATGPAGSLVCGFAHNGSLFTHLAQSGTPAPGAGGANYRTFASITNGGSNVVYKATLTGPTSENEGVWRNVTSILLRKGADVNNALYGAVKFNKIIRIWPASNDATKVLVHCTLSGTGVNSSNNQALVLIQFTNGNTILMRTGTDPSSLSPVARGISSATIKSISAVDVSAPTGNYTVLTTLNGSPAASNQALWTGNTQVGNDSTLRTLREPTLRLRKGDRYTSGSTALGSIKAISITPAPDASGSGSRGLAQCIGASGQVAATITADRNITELVLLP